MGKPGRKSKPTAMKIAEGNPGRRKINTHYDFTAEKEFPRPPPILGREGRKEWRRIGPGYWSLGVINDYNLQIFTAYCQAYEEWRNASSVLEEMRKRDDAWHKWFFLKTTNGNLIKNTINSDIKQWATEMCRRADELGLRDVAKKLLELGLSKKQQSGTFGKYTVFSGGRK